MPARIETTDAQACCPKCVVFLLTTLLSCGEL